MIQRRISDSARAGRAVEQRRAVKHDRQPRAAILGSLHLGDHVLQEQERAVVDPRQPGAEPSVESLGLGLLADLGLDLLPLDPERRIREQVVVPLALVVILGERVAVGDMGGVLALEHHVRAADRVRLRVELLPEHLEARLRVQRPQMVLGDRQHPAGPARRVAQRFDDPRLGQHVLVVDEQQVDHQPDHLARGEVLAGGLVGELGEPADQLLVQVAHLDIRDGLRVQVDFGELSDHLVEHVRAAQSIDLDREVELVDHVLRRRREPADVERERVGDRVRIVEQLRERERAGVEELLAGDGLEDGFEVLDLAGQLLVSLQDGVFGRLEHAVEPADHGEREDHLAVLGLLVVAAQEVRDRPDERGVVTDRLAVSGRRAQLLFQRRVIRGSELNCAD